MGSGGSSRAFYDSSLSDQIASNQRASNENDEVVKNGPSSPIDLQQINATKDDLDSFHVPFPMDPSVLRVPYYNKYPFQDYRFMKKIGNGRFCSVFKAYKLQNRRNTSERVAVKEIEANFISSTQYEDLRYEMSLLSQLNHLNIVQIICVYEPPTINSKLYAFYEYIRGGELFTSLLQQSHYSLYDILDCFQQVFSALQYLHAHGVIHGNLIPENIVLLNKYGAIPRAGNIIKLVGFHYAECVNGFGKQRPIPKISKEPIFIAPERRYVEEAGNSANASNGFSFFQFSTGSNPSASNTFNLRAAGDIWPAAAMLYFLISAELPEYESTGSSGKLGFFRKASTAMYENLIFPTTRVWQEMGPSAKEFFQQSLHLNPAQRGRVKELQRNDWFKRRVSETEEGNINLSDNLEEIKHFQRERIRSYSLFVASGMISFQQAARFQDDQVSPTLLSIES